MLTRMMARIITLGHNMARLLDDPLIHLGHNNISNIYVKVTEYLNSLISVVNLAHGNIETGRKDLQLHQTT